MLVWGWLLLDLVFMKARLARLLLVTASIVQCTADVDGEGSAAFADGESTDESTDYGSGPADSGLGAAANSVYVMEHGFLTGSPSWKPRGTMMLSGQIGSVEARLSDAQEFVQLRPELQTLLSKAASAEQYYAIRMYNPESPQRVLQAAIPAKLLADHFEDWHDILEVNLGSAGVPVGLSYRVKHTLGLMLFDHTQVHLSEPVKLDGPIVPPAQKDAAGNVVGAGKQPEQQSFLRKYWWAILLVLLLVSNLSDDGSKGGGGGGGGGGKK